MGIVKRYTDYRVEVEPTEPWLDCDKTHERRLAQCEELRRDIRRHVDGIASARVLFDAEGVCEHCGAFWTEGLNDPHNGGCCDEDAKAMPEEIETATEPPR